MEYTQAEILQTVRMTEMEHLAVRTVTLGLSRRDCVRATAGVGSQCKGEVEQSLHFAGRPDGGGVAGEQGRAAKEA